MKAEKVTVLTVPRLICDGSSGSANYPVSCLITNEGPNTVYLGGVDVTVADGYAFTTAMLPIGFELVGDDVYGITASTTVISVIHTGSATA